VLTVDKLDRNRGVAVLKVVVSNKGKPTFERLVVNLAGDEKA